VISVSASRHTAGRPSLGVSATGTRESAGPPLSRLSRTGEQLTQKPLARPLGTRTPRPTSHSHLTKRPAVARATAGKVLAAGCTRQGQPTRRGLSSPSMRVITSTTWSVDRASWPSSSSCWQRSCHLRPSRSSWPWAASLACACKAHKVEDNGGDEACSGAPQAAMLTTLDTLRPLLGVSSPWYQISFLALGSCSTSASCSSLVEEVRPASSARGRGCRWTGQPRLSNRHVGA
jgi:hypothetical protein